ncbi:MAG: response regulator, partial [Polyangiaceae bacterium]|nr:response regulator [Polyangiaceae bacterium]
QDAELAHQLETLVSGMMESTIEEMLHSWCAVLLAALRCRYVSAVEDSRSLVVLRSPVHSGDPGWDLLIREKGPSLLEIESKKTSFLPISFELQDAAHRARLTHPRPDRSPQRCLAFLLTAGEKKTWLIAWDTDPTMTQRTQTLWTEILQSLAALGDSSPPPNYTPEDVLASLGEVNRLAALGLQLETSFHALEAPASSLSIRCEESLRTLEETMPLFSPTERWGMEGLRQLMGSLEDIHSTALAIREQLCSGRRKNALTSKTTLKVSEVLREAVAIARPELEHRGLNLDTDLFADGYVQGHHQDHLQLLLGILFSLGSQTVQPWNGHALSLELRRIGERLQLKFLVKNPGELDLSEYQPSSSTYRLLSSTHSELTTSVDHLRLEIPELLEKRQHVPQVTPQATPLDSPRPSVPVPARILLIDDDPAFSRSLQRSLIGHEIVACATASEAEIALSQAHWIADLVICDLWLPGTSGRELHFRLKTTRAKDVPPFVFISGSAYTAADRAYFQEQDCPYLAKPLARAHLQRLISQALEQRKDRTI